MKLRSDTALLLSSIVWLLLRHVSDHAGEVDRVIAFASGALTALARDGPLARECVLPAKLFFGQR